jgi:hypothetical protein
MTERNYSESDYQIPLEFRQQQEVQRRPGALEAQVERLRARVTELEAELAHHEGMGDEARECAGL